MNPLWRVHAREWLADHLPAMHWMLLALWVPPVAFTIAVNLGWIAGAGTGYLRLGDPSLVLAAAQVVLMAAAMPGMSQRYSRSWWLASAALVAWVAHAAWNVQGRVRLSGGHELLAIETIMSLTGLLLMAGVLAEVRRHFSWPLTIRIPIPLPPAVPLRGMTSGPENRYQTPESRVG